MSFVRGTPVPAADGGTVAVTLLPGTVDLLSALVSIPVMANSAWVQCIQGTGFDHRMDGDVSGTAWQYMPQFSYLPLSNKQMLERCVIQVPAGGITLGIQFFQGAVGPVPPVPVVELAGGGPPGPPPPPPPGSANIPTQNVCHVMENGSDATGTRNRMDLPFRTVAAAEAEALPNDTIVVWQGGYPAQGLGTKRISWLLMEGSALTCTANTMFTVTEDIDIGGSGRLQVSGGDLCMNIGSGRTVKMNGVDIVSAAEGIRLNGGRIIGTIPIMACQGPCIATGNVSSIEVVGNMSSEADGCIVDVFGLNGWVRGNINSNTENAVYHQSGTFTVYGSVTSAGLAVNSPGDAITNIYGNITGAGSEGAVLLQNVGIINIYGNITNLTGGACDCTGGGIINIYGNCTTQLESVQAIVGTINIHGNITSAANTTGAVVVLGGTVNITGNVLSSSNGAAVNVLSGTAWINGRTLNGSTGVGLRVQGGAAVHVGDVTSTLGVGVQIQAGTASIQGNVRGNSTLGAYNVSGGSLLLWGNATNNTSIGALVTGGRVDQYGSITTASARGLVVSGGTEVNIHGDVIGGSQGFGVNTNTASTIIRIYGRCVGLTAPGATLQDAPNMVLHLYGEVVGATVGASIATGTMHVYNLVRGVNNNTNGITINGSTASVILYASARLQAVGGGTALFTGAGNTPTVRSYQASGNTLPSGTITVVGTYNVIV